MTFTYAGNTHAEYDNVVAYNTAVEELARFNIEDFSYSNDTCPSIGLWIEKDKDTFVQLFVDYANPEMRECEEMLEFCAVHYVEGDMIDDASFDNLNDAIDFMRSKAL